MTPMQGEHTALFLRHEGFLGAMGAFLKTNPIPTPALQRVLHLRVCVPHDVQALHEVAGPFPVSMCLTRPWHGRGNLQRLRPSLQSASAWAPHS